MALICAGIRIQFYHFTPLKSFISYSRPITPRSTLTWSGSNCQFKLVCSNITQLKLFRLRILETRVVYYHYYYYLLVRVFHISLSCDGLSLEFEWHQVSSSIQDSSQYSGRSHNAVVRIVSTLFIFTASSHFTKPLMTVASEQTTHLLLLLLLLFLASFPHQH